MAERNLNRAEELLTVIKTGEPAQRQAAVKELVRSFSPLLSEEYEKYAPADDKARKTTLLAVFRETFADKSAMQSAEVLERSLHANLMKAINAGAAQNEMQKTFSTTQMVNMVADETAPAAEDDDEPKIFFGSSIPAESPAPAAPQPAVTPKTVTPSAEPSAVNTAAAQSIPAAAPAEKKPEPVPAGTPAEVKPVQPAAAAPAASAPADSTAEESEPEAKPAAAAPVNPKPKKKPKPKPKPAEPEEEEDEDEESAGLPRWAFILLEVLAVILLFVVLLLGLRSFAPSAYNGIADTLNSFLPIDLPLAEREEGSTAPETEEVTAETTETAETAVTPEQTAETQEAAVTPEPTQEPTPEPTPAGPTVIGRATVNVDKLNIREEPNTNSVQRGQAERGRTYDVYEVTTDDQYTWYRIDDNLWFADNGTWITYETN